MPLDDFAKAYEGPPTDPKVFEEQQRKLQEELQKTRGRGAQEAARRRRRQPTWQALQSSAIACIPQARARVSSALFSFVGDASEPFSCSM